MNGMNYCHEICELLEIRGFFRTSKNLLATGLVFQISEHYERNVKKLHSELD